VRICSSSVSNNVDVHDLVKCSDVYSSVPCISDDTSIITLLLLL